MGMPGDLLLIFADMLTRSWKQVTKFREDGSQLPSAGRHALISSGGADADDDAEPDLEAGWIREERGVRYVSGKEARD
jgi:cyanophycin synthetase